MPFMRFIKGLQGADGAPGIDGADGSDIWDIKKITANENKVIIDPISIQTSKWTRLLLFLNFDSVSDDRLLWLPNTLNNGTGQGFYSVDQREWGNAGANYEYTDKLIIADAINNNLHMIRGYIDIWGYNGRYTSYSGIVYDLPTTGTDINNIHKCMGAYRDNNDITKIRLLPINTDTVLTGHVFHMTSKIPGL